MRRALLALLAIVGLEMPARAGDPGDTFGLSVAVAEEDSPGVWGGSAEQTRSAEPQRRDVQPEGWIAAQIASAEKLFAPIGIHFRWTMKKPLKRGHLETRADRDALASELETGVINVFVVESLRDVDEPDRYRMGVCWRRGDGKPFVIVASNARPTVLAHELGHFFGNGHSTVPNNVMSYVRTDAEVFFDAKQIGVIRATAARYRADGFIVPLGPARLFP
jgi:hypothetical protein